MVKVALRSDTTDQDTKGSNDDDFVFSGHVEITHTDAEEKAVVREETFYECFKHPSLDPNKKEDEVWCKVTDVLYKTPLDEYRKTGDMTKVNSKDREVSLDDLKIITAVD
jgi:hypothetical protein